MADRLFITAARLREVLDYDPHTGWFTWRVKTGPRTVVGVRAGTLLQDPRRPRWQIGVDGHTYAASRLAWLWMTGEWPDHEVDHENTDSTDDHWLNLRPATREQNTQNCNRRSDNTSGFKGVNRHGNRYYARIQVNGGRLFVGSFETPEEAAAAIVKRRQELHGAFCNHG